LRQGRLDVPLTPALALALFILAYVPYTQGIMFHTGAVALMVMGAYVLGFRPWLERRAAGQRVLRTSAFVGRHSLEIFLIHQPLMREYNRYLYARWFNEVAPSDAELIMGIALSVAVTLVLAVELHRFTNWLAKALIKQLPWMHRSEKLPMTIEADSQLDLSVPTTQPR
jgi:peptidoglycan/LPS O-acetylase OafA/YrhL